MRKSLGHWRRLGLYAAAMGTSPGALEVRQLPHEVGACWVALPFEAHRRPPAGRVSLVLYGQTSMGLPGADQPWAGLFLDEWMELIPSAEEDIDLVFHYDSPNAEAPQALLVAVPPESAEHWSLDDLVRILDQTLDLAKIRAVEVLPTPRAPVNRYACPTRLVVIALLSALDTCCCPTRSSKVWGR